RGGAAGCGLARPPHAGPHPPFPSPFGRGGTLDGLRSAVLPVGGCAPAPRSHPLAPSDRAARAPDLVEHGRRVADVTSRSPRHTLVGAGALHHDHREPPPCPA